MDSFPERRFIFRADGNAVIGLGHVVRLLALADRLHGPVPGVFVVREPSTAVTQMIIEAGWKVQALPAGQSLEAEVSWLATSFLRPADVLLLDGYEFDLAYQQHLRQSGCKLVFIDDLRAWPVVADVLINHSPGVLRSDYQFINTCKAYLGPAFSLLRPSFLGASSPPQPAPDQTSVLLCFGGADPLRLTVRTLEALLALALPQFKQLSVVAGSAFSDAAALQALATQHLTRKITLYRNISAAAFVGVLQAHAVVIVPASTVLIEALVLGRPVLTGYYADNQRALASYVHTHQQAFSVGNFANLVGDDLLAALRQGLNFLACSPRNPYVDHFNFNLLRTAIFSLLPH